MSQYGASQYGTSQNGAAGLGASGYGPPPPQPQGGLPPQGSVPRLPPPHPIDISGPQFSRFRAAKGMGGSVYHLMEANKISTKGSQDRRLIVLTALFVFQVRQGSDDRVARVIPLDLLKKVQTDGTKVLFKVKEKSGFRDWLFTVPGGKHQLEELVKKINQCRQPLMEPNAELLQIDNRIDERQLIAKEAGTKSVAELAQMYNRNPRMLPSIKNPVSNPNDSPPPPAVPPADYQPAARPDGLFLPPDQSARLSGSYLPFEGQHSGSGMDGFQDELDYTVFAPLNDFPSQRYQVNTYSTNEDLGFHFNIGPPDVGVRVQDVIQDGPFHRAGIPAGQILSVNGREITSEDTLRAAVHEIQNLGLTSFSVELVPNPHLKPLPPFVPPDSEGLSSEYEAGEKGEYDDDGDEDQDPEEVLAGKLQKVAALRRRGLISNETYGDTKDHIISLLSPERQARSPSGYDHEAPSGEADHRSFPPPTPWGEVNINNYIYLRQGPLRGSDWTTDGGIHGVVSCLHCIGDWCCVRTDDGVQGYMRTKYLNFLSQPQASRQPRTQAHQNKLIRKQLSDLLSHADTEMGLSPTSSRLAARQAYDPSAKLLPPGNLSPRVRSLGAPSVASWGPSVDKDVLNDELAWLTV
ncbi:hypothetical protein DIPPA_31255 [Diplonema papillatum]|nr:hypothetical protein DIPPA_31255 [Diplonema papillatum]KAJ9444844.1 hypothetical protein DIPPA_31255 [Diplonema papillatum]